MFFNSYRNLDIFIIKKLIYKSISDNIDIFQGKCLDIGCGKMPYKKLLQSSKIDKYLSLDIPNTQYQSQGYIPDYLWDGKIIPFENESFDCILCTEVIEHCYDVNSIISEMYRILKPNGIIFLTTPFVWPLHCIPEDYHRFTPFTLSNIFFSNRFKSCSIVPNGGWHATLAQVLALWVTNGIQNFLIRKVIKILIAPIVLFLYLLDKPSIDFKDRTISVGFYGIIKK